MKFRVVIPARYASRRLPGKPLLDIVGKTMIQHVYERAVASGADDVIIATDDDRIYQAAQYFDAHVVMTSDQHHSGTDRLSEVAQILNFSSDDVVVNLQGDEPLMPASLIRQVAENLSNYKQASIATLYERIKCVSELFDPHVVKVVMDHEGYALYFSRASIPWDRDAFSVSTAELPKRSEHYRHVGLYAYRAGFLEEYVSCSPCALESMESLEQLRALWLGKRIHVAEALEHPGHGVDTEDDLVRLRELLSQG